MVILQWFTMPESQKSPKKQIQVHGDFFLFINHYTLLFVAPFRGASWVSSLQFDQIHTSFLGGGGWTNPLEKYDGQISPEFGVKRKPIWNHHVVEHIS